MSRHRIAPWLPAPALLYLVALSLVPCALVIAYSFYERDFHGGVKATLSLEAWRQATDAITLKILARSLLLAASVTVIDVLLGYLCAEALRQLSPGWRGLLVILITFPLVTSLLLRIYGWMNLLPLEFRGQLWAVGLVLAMNYLPFAVLPLLRALERIDPDLHRAAADLGASPWQAFWGVTFPLTRTALFAACALVFIPVSGEYLVPRFIGDGHVTVLGTVIVQKFMERRNWPYAAAAAVWMILIVLVPIAASLLRKSRTMAELQTHDELLRADQRTNSQTH